MATTNTQAAPDGAQSYKDGSYDALDAQTSAKLGLPTWLLPSIRTQGEKSNADQVSSAGARTVYQITPTTRDLALKQYGIDPYLSAGNASMVAGMLLKDSMQRNNGSVPQAIGEYIGGTNRSNWGSTTNAYIKRVLQGAGGAAQQPASNPYAAARATADQTAAGVGTQLPNANSANLPAGPSIAKLVDAYNSGTMDPQARADFAADVQGGKVFLPAGIKLNTAVPATQDANNQPQPAPQQPAQDAAAGAPQSQPGMPAAQSGPPGAAPAAGLAPSPQATPQAVPLKVVQAYQSGQMDPQAKAEFEADLKAGKISLPAAQTPEQQGFLSQVGRQLGLFARDAIQGVGNTIGIAYDPIAATINTASQALSPTHTGDLITGNRPGTHIGTAGGYAHQLADTLGLPTPANDRERLVNAATEAGIGGATFAGAAGALAGAAPAGTTAAGTLSGLAEAPAAQTVASAAGGGAQERARQGGAGPLLQTAANIGAAMVAPSRAGATLAKGAEMLGQRVAPDLTARIKAIVGDSDQPLRQAAEQVAAQIQKTPRDVAFDQATGDITKEGRELAIASGLTPDGLRKAYGKLEVASGPAAANEATQNAEQLGIQYTKGQATRDFKTQDKEQTLAKAATPEGDQARAFFDQQSKQINDAVDNFRAGFGDNAATAADRGAAVQDSMRALRSQGQAGVRALYKTAAELPGEPVPIEAKPIIDSAARVITEMPTEPSIKEAIQNTLAKYGVLGGEVSERGPFGNTVSVGGKNYQITGEVEPLTLANAEKMRQALNAIYRADKTGHTGSVIAALDDGVENAVAGVAQRANVANPEVGQQMTHTAGGVSTPATYEGPGAAPNTARVTLQPAAQSPQDVAATAAKLSAERDALSQARAQTGEKITPQEQALSAAVGPASAKDRMTAVKWAQANNRPDVTQAVLSSARSDLEAATSAAQPKNPAMMAVQEKARQQFEKSVQNLHDAAGVPYGTNATREVPTAELSAGSTAPIARQEAFEKARAAARTQKQTYEAKDVIQDLTDYKTGTNTPKVLPENSFTPLFGSTTNLNKAKALLLADDAGGRGAGAWKAIQSQALAHIAEQAKNPQTGDYSAARLNSALKKFGDDKLKILFEGADYNRLKSLQAAIDRTQPMSGTVNYSNTFTKFANLVGAHLSDAVAAVGTHVAGPAGMLAGKGLGMIAEKVATARKESDVLKGMVSPNLPGRAAAQKRVDSANQDLIDSLLDAARRNAFVPYGITNSNTEDNKK